MRNIKLILEFDGSRYSGWLRQTKEGIVTVQAVVEDAIRSLTGESAEVIGCSRTDAGVHALNYAANFQTSCTIPPERIYKALNALLPPDIKVKSSVEVPSDFHAVYDAKRKTYRYYFYFDEVRRPLLQGRAWNAARKTPGNPEKILRLMNLACEGMLGEHDFSAFKTSGGLAKTTVRTIYSASVRPFAGNLFYLEICGNGFLYNMVRIIAGTLASVAEGRILPTEIEGILRSKERKKAGMTAPPHGLYLYDVVY